MEKHLTLSEAIDDFAENIFPNLFPEGRKGNNEYYRIKNLFYSHAAEKAGRKPRRRITANWAQSILTKYAPERYEFTSVVILHDGQ